MSYDYLMYCKAVLFLLCFFVRNVLYHLCYLIFSVLFCTLDSLLHFIMTIPHSMNGSMKGDTS